MHPLTDNHKVERAVGEGGASAAGVGGGRRPISRGCIATVTQV
jgi:hypothetical protein